MTIAVFGRFLVCLRGAVLTVCGFVQAVGRRSLGCPRSSPCSLGSLARAECCLFGVPQWRLGFRPGAVIRVGHKHVLPSAGLTQFGAAETASPATTASATDSPTDTIQGKPRAGEPGGLDAHSRRHAKTTGHHPDQLGRPRHIAPQHPQPETPRSACRRQSHQWRVGLRMGGRGSDRGR